MKYPDKLGTQASISKSHVQLVNIQTQSGLWLAIGHRAAETCHKRYDGRLSRRCEEKQHAPRLSHKPVSPGTADLNTATKRHRSLGCVAVGGGAWLTATGGMGMLARVDGRAQFVRLWARSNRVTCSAIAVESRDCRRNLAQNRLISRQSRRT